ncbi:hypothetical protein PS2_008043 [Malus domestica]
MMSNSWRDEQHPSFINFISAFLAANSFRRNFVPISPDFIFNCGGSSVAFVFVTSLESTTISQLFGRSMMADIESPKAGNQVVYLFNTSKEHGTTLVVVILEAAILVSIRPKNEDAGDNYKDMFSKVRRLTIIHGTLAMFGHHEAFSTPLIVTDIAKSRVVAIEKSDDIQRRYNDVIGVLHRRHGGWATKTGFCAVDDVFYFEMLLICKTICQARGLVQTLGHPFVQLKGNFSRESSFTTVDITDEIYGRTTVEDDPSNSPFVMDPTIRYYAIGGRLTGVHHIYMTRCSQAFLEDLIVGTLIKLNRGWEHLAM